MGAAYARSNTHDPLPKFDTMDKWFAKKSTKIDACARLCQHLLSRDDALDPINENGELSFPPPPTLQPGEAPTQSIKVLIYQEFPSLSPILTDVRL